MDMPGPVRGRGLGCQAAIYYLDFESGSDSNAGPSRNTAWKTLEKVNRAKIQPEDRVLFKSRGSMPTAFMKIVTLSALSYDRPCTS